MPCIYDGQLEHMFRQARKDLRFFPDGTPVYTPRVSWRHAMQVENLIVASVEMSAVLSPILRFIDTMREGGL